MNAVEKIQLLCKERNVRISNLEKSLGFANGYIRGLKKGTLPSDRLQKVANYFDVPVTQLIGDEIDVVSEISEPGFEKAKSKAASWFVEFNSYKDGFQKRMATYFALLERASLTDDEYESLKKLLDLPDKDFWIWKKTIISISNLAVGDKK